MKKIKILTTKPEYEDKEYYELLSSELQADIIIYDNNNYLDFSNIESDLNVVVYEHGPYGNGGWDFLSTLFFQISEITRGIKDPIAIFIAEKTLEKAGNKLVSLLQSIRSKSKKRNFRLFIAKTKDNFSEYTVNSFLTDKEFTNALIKLNKEYKNKPQGDYVFDRQSNDWQQE